MNYELNAFNNPRDTSIKVIVVSQVCVFRECMSQCLADDYMIQVLDTCSTIDQALQSIQCLNLDMVLIDARFAGGAMVAAELCKAACGAQIVALALEESEENVLDWALAGIAGYVADTASMHDFPQLLRQIRWGRQAFAAHIIGGLLRRIERIGHNTDPYAVTAATALTPRERVIQQFIGAGLSNKDIARQLDISVGTAKAHAHNILKKLNLSSRTQIAAQLGGMRVDLPVPGPVGYQFGASKRVDRPLFSTLQHSVD